MPPKRKTKEQLEAGQKELVLKVVEDAVHNFLYNDRKEDKKLSAEALFNYIDSNIVSTGDIVNTFARELRREVEK